MRLPEFLIIGGQRCGSSACAKNIEKHPDVGIARWEWYGQQMPELHYFDLHWHHGASWYSQKFEGMGQKLVGEKTPEYFHRPQCHERMAEMIPEAKLIVLLRNPADRIYSAFNYARQHVGGQEWFGPTYPTLGTADGFDRLLNRFHESQEWGQYAQLFGSLFEHFDGRQIHIEISERVKADMVAGYDRIYKFLGLDPIADPGYVSDYNAIEYDEPMSDGARQILAEMYGKSNEHLRRIMMDEIPEWT